MNVVLGTGLLISVKERTVGQNGNRIAEMSLVLNKPRKKNPQTGEYENQPGTFIDVESWNVSPGLVQYMNANLKNCLVTYVGRLEQDTWKDKTTGQERKKLKIVAETLTAKEKPARKDYQGGGQQQTQQVQQPQTETVGAAVAEDDIPF